MVRTNRIRSKHQRRVLDWLADGGGTVTEVSNALGIRVPHASAALKKLRESGDGACGKSRWYVASGEQRGD